jgi:hypothetical protein
MCRMRAAGTRAAAAAHAAALFLILYGMGWGPAYLLGRNHYKQVAASVLSFTFLSFFRRP